MIYHMVTYMITGRTENEMYVFALTVCGFGKALAKELEPSK